MLWLAGSMSFTSCSSDDDPNPNEGGGSENEKQKQEIVADYVDLVVLPTYKEMKDRGWVLYEKMKAFYESTGSAEEKKIAFEACGDAWREMREPWEESEAFLFGPADGAGLDPSLDSWPLDQVTINEYLTNNSNSVSYEDMQKELADDVKGFHTIEYFLFENGVYADPSTLTPRKKQYLFSITKILRDNAIQLWASWNGNQGLTTRDREVLEGKNSYDWDNSATKTGTAFTWGEKGTYQNGYAKGFKAPSLTGNAYGYKTFEDCLNQILDGCTTICTEVGEQKIGTPYDMWKSGQTQEAVYKVESWYSWNSLADYKDNIRSIQNSYYGGIDLDEPTSRSMSAYVAEVKPELDTQIKAQITKTIDAIGAIPAPFRNNLGATSEITYAQNQLVALSNLLTKVKAVW